MCHDLISFDVVNRTRATPFVDVVSTSLAAVPDNSDGQERLAAVVVDGWVAAPTSQDVRISLGEGGMLDITVPGRPVVENDGFKVK